MELWRYAYTSRNQNTFIWLGPGQVSAAVKILRLFNTIWYFDSPDAYVGSLCDLCVNNLEQ